MFYVFPITIPKNTPQSDPLITEITLGPGEITRVGVGFVWGNAGLAYVQIWRAEHQMWPTNAPVAFAWNDIYYWWDESEKCTGPTEPWSIRCWNLDERNSQDIEVCIGILPLEKTVLGKVAQSLFGGG